MADTDSPNTSTENTENTEAAEATSPSDTVSGEEMLADVADSGSSAVKDPENWVTGDEPMTGPQKSYLGTLAREAGEELPADLNKAEASENIDRLQKATGRGQ